MVQAVSPEMRAQIENKLSEIEQEENARILLAIESGSRAWGFHSPDSDYDVRFVYARPLDWHFRLGKKRDVIERPINDELDVSGWELSKALSLTTSSNAVIAEWLQSPIVYRKEIEAVDALTSFARKALDRKSITWHYVSLFNRQEKRIAHPEGGIRFKRWFYMLRPAMALRWMRVNGAAMSPMDMAKLRSEGDLSSDLESRLDEVIARKMAAGEGARLEASDKVLDDLIQAEISQAQTCAGWRG